MVHGLFLGTAISYVVALVLEGFHRISGRKIQKSWSSVLERFAFFIFTAGVIVLGYKSNLETIEPAKYSFAWILLTWAIAGANLLTEVLYHNRISKLGTFAWIIFVLVLFPAPESGSMAFFFEGGLNWLNFHRIVFIVGYAFYFLGLPVVTNFIWTNIIYPFFVERPKGAVLEHHTRELERVHTNLILWALPFLSLGIFTKVLVLIEDGNNFDAQTIWQTSQQEILAITTWFTCSLFLFARIFLKLRYRICAYVYIAGLIFVIYAHLSGRMQLQIS